MPVSFQLQQASSLTSFVAGFVFNGSLNALSQYCYMQYFKDLPAKKASIEQQIREFHSKFKGLVPQPNYIVDFAVTQAGIVQIVELNPFVIDFILRNPVGSNTEVNATFQFFFYQFQDTSACLFDWKNEEDRKKIQNGPFEFRILEHSIDDPYGCLSPDWRDFFEELRGLSSRSKRRKEQANRTAEMKTEGSDKNSGNCTVM